MRTGLIAGTVMYAISRGVPMARITEETGLRPGDLADQDGWLPESVMPAVWRLIAEACPGEAVALAMAEAAPFSLFGPLAQVCRHAADARGVLQAFIRYRFVLSDNLAMELVEDEDIASVRIEHPMDALDGGLAAEMGLALGTRFAREILAAGHGLHRVELRHAPLGPLAAYEAFFAAPVRFEQAHNALVFRAADLAAPTRQPNPALYRFIESHLQVVRERLAAEAVPDELARIRDAIAVNAERAEFGAGPLARRVGMSLRTVQRVVRAHGTTVRALLEEAREAHARELLSDPRLSVEQVSFLLGYSEDRAFRRSFKRWTGQTPGQLRRALRAARAG